MNDEVEVVGASYGSVIDSQIMTAKQFPRNEAKFLNNVKLILLDSKVISKSCTYSLKKSGKSIVGPSVYLARLIAQKYQNVRVESKIVSFDDLHVTAEASCIDLENNYAVRSVIKKSIVGNSGRYSNDMATVAGNAAAAIAFRNVVFAVVPQDLVNKCWDTAKKSVTGEVDTEDKLKAQRSKLISGIKSSYSDQKLTDLEICASVGKSSIEHLVPDDLVVIIGYDNSIKEGEMSFDEIFRPHALKQIITDKSESRMLALIESATNEKELMDLKPSLSTNKTREAFDNKLKSFK